MYTWGYVKDAALAYLDLTESEAIKQKFLNRFPIYANTVITEISSAIKPKHAFAEFEISKDDINVIKAMPKDFISFGSDVCTIEHLNFVNDTILRSCNDEDFKYYGDNKIVFYKIGKYKISYNARWQLLSTTVDNNVLMDMPYDIVECIPLYIASQCYKSDDQYKAAQYRNEYEMALARIDDTDYRNTKTFTIRGDW